jgi:secondary thiamine-phosphate synthase enzyme
MRQEQHEITVSTRGRGFYKITEDVSRFVRKSKMATGLAVLHIEHTSASLLIQENADPEVRGDLERFFQRLVPDGDRVFQHTTEGQDDMPAHVRTALTSVNISIPFSEGEMRLGTWQGIYVWEHRTHPHKRKVLLHLVGE